MGTKNQAALRKNEVEGKGEPTEKQYSTWADQILHRTAADMVSLMLWVGRYLFTQVFHGSEDAFRSKDRTKADSIAKLASRPEMMDGGWGRNRLDRAIELFLLSKSLGSLGAWPHLQLSHYAEVMGMPQDQQKALLDQAEKEHWTVAQLRKAAGKATVPSKPAGRLPGPPGSADPSEVLGEVKQALTTVDGLSDPLRGISVRLCEAGIDPDATAPLGLALMDVHNLLRGFEADLEQLKKDRESTASPRSARGRAAKKG